MTAVFQERFLVLRSARSEASETKATRVQRPLTTTSVTVPLDWRPRLVTDTRFSAPERRSNRNASGLPLVSPRTRFEAAETKATQCGAAREVPSSDGLVDGPLAGWPPRPREARTVSPARQGVPFSPYGSARRTT